MTNIFSPYATIKYMFAVANVLHVSSLIKDITLEVQSKYRVTMDLQTANTASNVAIETANGLGVKFCIAVMDSGVNLVAFNRMDGGRVGTNDVAMKKVKH